MRLMIIVQGRWVSLPRGRGLLRVPRNDGATARAPIPCSEPTAAGRSTSAATDEDGRSRRYTVYGGTPKEARPKPPSVRERLRVNLPARDRKVTLGAFAAEWIDSTLAASDRKASTKAMSPRLARQHIIGSKIGARPLDKLRPSHIEAWKVELEHRRLSDVHHPVCIHNPPRRARHRRARQGHSADQAHAVRVPGACHGGGLLTPDQVRSLLLAANDASLRFAPDALRAGWNQLPAEGLSSGPLRRPTSITSPSSATGVSDSAGEVVDQQSLLRPLLPPPPMEMHHWRGLARHDPSGNWRTHACAYREVSRELKTLHSDPAEQSGSSGPPGPCTIARPLRTAEGRVHHACLRRHRNGLTDPERYEQYKAAGSLSRRQRLAAATWSAAASWSSSRATAAIPPGGVRV